MDDLEQERSVEIPCVVRPQSLEELDEAGYLAANPDVPGHAKEHFKRYGKREGRVQCVNVRRVAEMREEKLRRVRFRRDPLKPRALGEAVDFLPGEMLTALDMPAAPVVSFNPYGGEFWEEVLRHPSRLCLDVGAGLRFQYASNIVNTEIYPSPSTDVLCVGEDLPFADDQFDYVACLAVLEHTMKPWVVAREMCRVLKPGGRIQVGYPFLARVHGYPHHYFNATPKGAASLFEPFCDIEASTIGPHQQPIYAVYEILEEWRLGLPERSRARFDVIRVQDFLSRNPYEQSNEFYCAELNEETRRKVAAGSTVLATKRARTGTLDAPKELNLEWQLAMARKHAAKMEETLAAERRACAEKVEEMLQSKSWRLTAPLRSMASMFRRKI